MTTTVGYAHLSTADRDAMGVRTGYLARATLDSEPGAKAVRKAR